jgi:hypothetical protein
MSSTSFFNVVSLELHAAVSFPLKRGFLPKYMKSFESWGHAQSSPHFISLVLSTIGLYVYVLFIKREIERDRKSQY